MRSNTFWRSISIAALSSTLTATAFLAFQGRARGQENATGAGPQPTQTVVLDTPRVRVRRMTFPVGSGVPMHTVPANRYDIMVQLTPAQFSGQVDDKRVISDKAGTVWEIPGAPSQHAFANLSQQPIDVIVVQLK